MDNKILVVMAILLLTLGSVIGALAFPREVSVVKTIEVPVEVEKQVEVIVEVPVEVEKIVEIDNGNLDLVLQYLEDNYGSEDVFEDMENIVANIKMEDSMKNKAVQYVAENWFDLLDDFDYLDNELDDYRVREIRLYKIYSDAEDVELLDIDYNDNEAEVKVLFKVKAEDEDDNKVSLKLAVELKYEDEEFDVMDMYED